LYPYLKEFQRQSTANLKHFFHVTAEDLANPFFSHLPRWELAARLKLLFSPELRQELGEYNSIEELEQTLPSDFVFWNHFNQAEYLEATYFLPGYLLSSQGDRMAMAHSVEGRYPFLDYRVVEFAAKLPANLKLKVLNEKYLLKCVCEGLIPDSIIRRRKQPYRAPDAKCFFDAGSPSYVREMLSPSAIKNTGIFDSRAVDAITSRFTAGKAGSVKDDMALVGVLSTQLLATQFSFRYQGRCEVWNQQPSSVKSATFS
jgi:asparagine synthase (glutamine-hydrolysing)